MVYLLIKKFDAMSIQVLMDYIKKKNSEFFLMLTKYPLKKHKINSNINQMKNILLNYIYKYSKKKIEINVVRLKYIYLNSNMLAEYIAIKLITKRRSLYKAKRKIFNKIKLVRYNKYNVEKEIKYIYNTSKLNFIKSSVFNDLSNVSLNSLYNNSIKYKKILSLIKYKFISGIRLVVAGRLTRRNVAARSIKKFAYMGSLKNIDSSFKGLSVVNLRGGTRPNLDYSSQNDVAKTGAFNVKSWTSYYGYSTLSKKTNSDFVTAE